MQDLRIKTGKNRGAALLLLALLGLTLASPKAMAQSYTYRCWDPSTHPEDQELNFMNLGDETHPYVKCRKGNTYNDFNTQTASIGTSVTSTHKLITEQADDPTRCYQAGNTYPHEPVLPPAWDGDPDHRLDKVIQIGCYKEQTPCTKSAEIEYWFKPQVDSSVLLIYFSFSEQDVNDHGSGMSGGGGGCKNPRFYIEVLDGQTNNLIASGYYKNKTSSCEPGTSNNTNWPYNRFLAVPSGVDAGNDCSSQPDDYGITTYYWAHPEATPTTFNMRVCPREQVQNPADGGDSRVSIKWFEYKPLAFDLTTYAEQGRAVKLRIRTQACSCTAHWAYGLFAAKMVSGKINVDACGDEPITLSVPWGFNEPTYTWKRGQLDANGVVNESTVRALDMEAEGIGGSVYDVVLDRAAGARVYPYYRCEMKSYTGVPFTYEAYIKSYYIEPKFTYEQIVDPDNPCQHVIQFTDSSRIGEVTPHNNDALYDTIWQRPVKRIEWFYQKDDGTFQAFGTGDTMPRVNFSTAQGINLDNFDFDNDSITIRLVIQDSLQKCSDTLLKNIALDPSFVSVGRSETSTVICESQLPWFYNRAKYQETYRFDRAGTMECRIGEDFGEKSWNGCDSIVTVTLSVTTPEVEIVEIGDYCDSFRTVLSVVPVAGSDFEADDINVKMWNGDPQTTGRLLTVERAGIYTAEVEIGETGCNTSASYRIAACKPFMNLPNTITPSNRDGMNDCFEIPQKDLIKSLEFTVFNRAGQVVYHTKDVNFKWCGGYQNDDLPDHSGNGSNDDRWNNQVYVYTLKIVDYNGKPYPVIKGSILVM